MIRSLRRFNFCMSTPWSSCDDFEEEAGGQRSAPAVASGWFWSANSFCCGLYKNGFVWRWRREEEDVPGRCSCVCGPAQVGVESGKITHPGPEKGL
jgi:hypothetical protein